MNGNVVNEMLANGQAMTDGGQGYLAHSESQRGPEPDPCEYLLPYLMCIRPTCHAFTAPGTPPDHRGGHDYGDREKHFRGGIPARRVSFAGGCNHYQQLGFQSL